VHPLLLTGPPAAGKSTTGAAVARMLPRAAFVDVDDVRQLVVSGHAAPWDGPDGRLQQRVGVENACDLTLRWRSVGIDVVVADVVNADTLAIYRRRLPGLVVLTLRLPLAAARRRAASRPRFLDDQEFEELHAAEAAADLEPDAVLDVEQLTPDEQAAAVLRIWAALDQQLS
jgi:hypothetical protein